MSLLINTMQSVMGKRATIMLFGFTFCVNEEDDIDGIDFVLRFEIIFMIKILS